MNLNAVTFGFTQLNLNLSLVASPCMLGSVSNFSAISFILKPPKILIIISSLFSFPSYEFHITTSLFITFLHLTGLINSFDTYPFLPAIPPPRMVPMCMPGDCRSDSAPAQQAVVSLLFQLSDKNPSSASTSSSSTGC